MPAAAALLDRLTARAATSKAEAEAGYWAAVRAAGRGERLDADDVAAAVEAAGRTAADFEGHVRWVEARVALAAKVALAPDVARELAAVKAAVAEQQAAYRVVQEQHGAAMRRAQFDIDRLTRAQAEASAAAAELVRDNPYPHLVERAARLDGAIAYQGELREAVLKRLDQNATNRRAIEVRQATTTPGLYDDDFAGNAASRAKHESDLAAIDAELTRLRGLRRDLDSEIRQP